LMRMYLFSMGEFNFRPDSQPDSEDELEPSNDYAKCLHEGSGKDLETPL